MGPHCEYGTNCLQPEPVIDDAEARSAWESKDPAEAGPSLGPLVSGSAPASFSVVAASGYGHVLGVPTGSDPGHSGEEFHRQVNRPNHVELCDLGPIWPAVSEQHHLGPVQVPKVTKQG